MKQSSADNVESVIANIIPSTALLPSIFLLNSFTSHRIGDDFMKVGDGIPCRKGSCGTCQGFRKAMCRRNEIITPA